MSPEVLAESFAAASSEQASVERDYSLVWRRRRSRRRIVLRLLMLSGALLIAGVTGLIRHATWAAIPLGLLFPVLMMANLVWIWSLFLRCPRCKNPFGTRVIRGRSTARNPFSSVCMSCGLPLRTKHSTPVR